MSQIIASDAPLLSSPISDSWEQQHQMFYSPPHFTTYNNYYNLPPSPPQSIGSTSSGSPIPRARMLKSRSSPESGSESDQQQLCLPTHQLFDLQDIFDSPSPASPPPPPRLGMPPKRASIPPPTITKKARASGERINSKDFIPPDVSGLSKREARLVKNRAAAFLSRQRKREEFENMEVRVAELEQENARLLAINRPDGEDPLVEQLRAQLAAAEERERKLNAQLASRGPPVKVEAAEPQFPPSSPIKSPPTLTQSAKSGSSLGLMVLMCALPTLLSVPSVPNSFSFPIPGSSALPASSSAFDYNSFIPNEYEWPRNSGSVMMDLDVDEQGRITASDPSAPSKTRRLEFADIEAEALRGMDISFDTSPSDGGKIRVRIHPSTLASPYTTKQDDPSSLAMWAGPNSSPVFGSAIIPETLSRPSSYSSSLSGSPTGDSDPFLGIGGSNGDFMSISQLSSPVSFGHSQSSGSFFGPDYGRDLNKRRVRVALKSFPTPGSEGGEWEVELC